MDQSGRLAAGGTASITTARSTLISRGNLTTGNSTNRQSYFDRKTLARSLSPEMIEPVPARRTVPPRSPPCTSSLQALKMMHTLPSEPTLSTWSARAPTRGVFLTGKMKFQDPEAQRAHAARNIALRPEPYRDPVLYQHGVLPDQHVPRRQQAAAADDVDQLRPADWLDAQLPRSLSAQQLASGKKNIAPPWDGTRKNIVSSKLWRPKEPIG
mmetsp:Transcript_5396/g.7941  ORF Transcript_5396/g.7941 Transcript_5396/m.7941 type:complete len:212 (-) Transcript_5396:121-756(-)